MKLLGCLAPWLSGTVLFTLFLLRLLLATQGRPLVNPDELSELARLLDAGAPWRLSLLLERSFLALLQGQPQRHFDLRLFFRIPSALCWCAANLTLFIFLYRRLRSHVGSAILPSCLLAGGAAAFCFGNDFAIARALEAGPAALWILLSFFQMLLLWTLLEGTRRWRFLLLFLGNNILLSFTAAPALLQTCVCCLLLLSEDFLRAGRFRIGRWQLFLAGNPVLSLLLTLFLAGRYPGARGSPAFLEGLRELLLKSFHHHGPQPALISFPILFLVIPWLWRRNRVALLMCLAAPCMIFLSGIASRACPWLSGISTPGQLAYLVPYLSFLYLAGLLFAARGLARLTDRISSQPSLPWILGLWSATQLFFSQSDWLRSAPSDLSRFRERRAWQYLPDPRCSGPLPKEASRLEEYNLTCRLRAPSS